MSLKKFKTVKSKKNKIGITRKMGLTGTKSVQTPFIFLDHQSIVTQYLRSSRAKSPTPWSETEITRFEKSTQTSLAKKSTGLVTHQM